MARPKKNVTKVTYTLDTEIVEMIDNFNKETDIPKSKIVEKAVRSYAKRRAKDYAKLEKEYGKFEEESFGWIDD